MTGRIDLFESRRPALADVMAAWERAQEGHGRVLGVAGSEGMGKTTFLEAVAESIEPTGFVARGRCWAPGDAPPLRPWSQIVRQLLKDLGTSTAVDLMGAHAPWLAELAPEVRAVLSEADVPSLESHDPLRLADALLSWMDEVANKGAMVLVIDDVELADEETLRVIEFFVREGRASRILLVTGFDEAVRVDEAASRTLGLITREGLRIDLAPLDETETEALLESVLGMAVPPPTVTAVHRASGGNPFFIVELGRLISETGDVHRPDASLGFRVPRGARDVMLRRVGSLPPEELRILEVAAVVGQEFEVRLLAALLDAEDSTVLDTLSSLASRGLVEEVSALGTFRFGHVLLRETLYESQSPSRRRATHEAVARVLETIGGGHSGVIADHYFKAGGGADPGKAASLALEAADAAVTRGAWRDQERYLHRALALAELAGWTSEDLAELRARLERLREGPLDGPDTAQTKNAFVREGDYWTISFEGNYARFRASKGIAHLARLLGSPGVEIHSLELAGGSPASTSDLTFRDRGDSGPILDVEAKRAYRERIHDLREEIGEAERDGDVERAGRARTELEFLVEELSAAVGLGGRDRRVSSASERARVTVTRGIRSAIARISEELPALGEHLSATIRTGTFALYEPDPRAPAGWVILG